MNSDEKNLIFNDIIKHINKNEESTDDLKKLIDISIIDNNITSTIKTKEVADYINKTYPEMCYKLKNGHYRLKSQPDTVIGQITTDPILEQLLTTDAHKIKEDTRIVTYSFFILLNISLIVLINEPYSYIIKPIFFTILSITYMCSASKNTHFLFYCYSLAVMLYSQNFIVLFFILSIIAFYWISKKIKKRPSKLIAITLVTFIFLVSLNNLDGYIDIKSYMMAKFAFIILLFSLFIWVNKFNIIHTALMLIISFSIYNLLSNLMQTLNDKGIIFHPYVEKFNFDFSITSVAITILIFSVPSIIEFINSSFNTNNFKKTVDTDNIWELDVTKIACGFVLTIIAIGFAYFFEINFLKMILTLILLFSLFFVFIAIICNEQKYYKLNNLVKSFNDVFFSANNENKFKLSGIENFYKPLQIDKKIPFNKDIYIENLAFIVISITIIITFIFSYNHIYHFKKNTNKECEALPTNTLYAKYNDVNNVYILYDLSLSTTQKNIKDSEKHEIVHDFKIKMHEGYIYWFYKKNNEKNMLILKKNCKVEIKS